MENIEIYPVSELDKILPDRTPTRWDGTLSGFSGQNASFQLAVNFGRANSPLRHLTARIIADGARVAAYKVELVPVSVPGFNLDKDGYLVDYPGLLPDRLSAIENIV